LPDPHSLVPTEIDSINKIDEFRPNFKGDVSASTVKPYIDQVIEDVVEAWTEMGEDEPHVDRKKVSAVVSKRNLTNRRSPNLCTCTGHGFA